MNIPFFGLILSSLKSKEIDGVNPPILKNPLSFESVASNWVMVSNWYFKAVVKKLKKVLEKIGISEVETQGKAFDPNFHEAIGSEQSADWPPGHVSRVFKKSYQFHEKVIRPAQVIVAKEPSPQENDAPETQNLSKKNQD